MNNLYERNLLCQVKLKDSNKLIGSYNLLSEATNKLLQFGIENTYLYSFNLFELNSMLAEETLDNIRIEDNYIPLNYTHKQYIDNFPFISKVLNEFLISPWISINKIPGISIETERTKLYKYFFDKYFSDLMKKDILPLSKEVEKEQSDKKNRFKSDLIAAIDKDIYSIY